MILAGGKGKRLGEITETIPKSMIEINGKPFLQTLIEKLKESGIEEIIIVVNYKKEQIIDYFSDGSEFGVKIKYAFQKDPMGTADAVRYVEEFIDDKFILIYGDVVFNYDSIKKILEEDHPIMCLKKVDNPKMFGVVEIEGDYVKSITEKTDNPKSNLVNAGVYTLPISIFDSIRKTELSERNEYEITDSIQMLINNNEKIKYLILEEWSDIGTPEELKKLKEKIK